MLGLLNGLTLLGQQQQDRPNIIFIMADDHALKAISSYSADWIQTPNIDRIGKEGAVFQEARVTNSVCSPSRAVILTGKYSHLNGMKDNGTYFNGAQVTLPKLLKSAGYQTAIIGKWHLFSEPTGFDYWDILPDQGNYYNPQFLHKGGDTIREGYVTDVITEQSIKWIDQHKKEPFFIMVHHKAPHRNAMPPLKYLNLLSKKRFPYPDSFFQQSDGRPAMERQQISFAKGLDIRYDSKIACDTCAVTTVNDWAPAEYQRELVRMTAEERAIWDNHYAQYQSEFDRIKNDRQMLDFQYQRFMQDYLSCITSLDENVGKLLDYLDESGLAQNTIVVYMSDQGFFLGEHGLYDKRFMYEEAFRTPMLMRYPNKINRGISIPDYVLNLDIAPTLLDYAGAPAPSDMQGRSMRKLLKGNADATWRKSVYYHYYETSFGLTKHEGVLQGRYKLIHFYDPVEAWEFYDLQEDALETHNRYSDPQYQDQVSLLKQELNRLQQELKVNP